MGFYFCGRYIRTKGDPKQVENDMYDVVPIFQGSYDLYGYEAWERNLEFFFQLFRFNIWAEVLLCSNEVGRKAISLGKW